MQYWNNIIQTAMLGADKRQPQPGDYSQGLMDVAAAIENNTSIDKEEKFLQIASVVFNYRQCGAVPLRKENMDLPVAATEEKPYCNIATIQVLKDILNEDSNSLLKIWLDNCVAKEQLAIPFLIPVLLNKAAQQPALRNAVITCCGKRGQWVSAFNKDWQFAEKLTNEELWQTGTPAQRRQLLLQLRNDAPAKAREWLQQTWPQENANSKADLLKTIGTNLSADDVDWLETLLTDKSQKVKDEALNLLKQIPSSSIVQHYWQIIQEAVTLKKEKAMFGLSTKNFLQIQLPAVIDENIFKTGIEKLSSQKEFTDEAFIIYQLTAFIPPEFWEAHFNETPQNILPLFIKSDEAGKFIPALVSAAGRFKNTAWSILFAQQEEKFYPELLPVLPVMERDKYLLKYIHQAAETVITYLTEKSETVWSMEITRAVFKHTASHVYQYNRSFYNQHISFIPVQIVNELEKFAPKDEYQRNSWNSISEYITKLINLKTQISNAFQSL